MTQDDSTDLFDDDAIDTGTANVSGTETVALLLVKLGSMLAAIAVLATVFSLLIWGGSQLAPITVSLRESIIAGTIIAGIWGAL